MDNSPLRRIAWPAVGFIAIFLLGFILADDYGQSWDDPTNALYGEDVLRAYVGSEDFLDHANLPYYGPFHFAGSALLVKLISALSTGWGAVDVRHFANFLAFSIAGLAFYLLARTIFSRWVSLAGTALFVTQPLLFGHGFINQKDMPFMAYFLLAVALGFRAVDWLPTGPGTQPGQIAAVGLFGAARDSFRRASILSRLSLLMLVGIFLVLLADALGNFLLLPLTHRLIEVMYQGEAVPILQGAFDAVATDAYKTPLDLYLQKATRVYSWVSVLLILIGFLALGSSARSIFGESLHRLGVRWRRGYSGFLVTGIFAGLATSIRIAGPLAGLLVVAYLFQKTRFRNWVLALPYVVLAGITSYLTWPALWGAPLQTVREALTLMGNYAEPHKVLFLGTLYPSSSLPLSYLPLLITFQLTVPALLLIIVGLAATILGKPGSSPFGPKLPWVVGWFALPVAAILIMRSPIYGNFRQLLFLVPPLFLFACAGLDWLSRPSVSKLLTVAGIVLMLAPGVVSNLRLHPFQYTYYNELVGGVRGASGRFDLDYWCTSYRQATAYVNRTAPEGASVVVWGPDRVVRSFARQDLVVWAVGQETEDPDYVLRCTHSIIQDWFYADVPLVYAVTVQGVPLAEVRSTVSESD